MDNTVPETCFTSNLVVNHLPGTCAMDSTRRKNRTWHVSVQLGRVCWV